MSWDRVERLLGARNLEVLARKHVVIVGCGSGGGFVALTLAMSGVGSFTLIDDDVMEENNIMRHVADRRTLGQPKVQAVADLILQRNPNAQIKVIIGWLENHLDALDGADLLISGLDGEQAKYVLNDASLKRRLPTVYAGVYERGEGGDVAIIRPYDGPCYACWASQLREDLATVKAGENMQLDYGMIGESGTLDAEPGLWLHVTRVAGTQADMALNELLRESDIYRALPGNTVILANTALEILDGEISQPYTAVWVTIERDPHCLVCGDGMTRAQDAEADDANAVSLESLLTSMGIEEAQAAPDTEAQSLNNQSLRKDS